MKGKVESKKTVGYAVGVLFILALFVALFAINSNTKGDVKEAAKEDAQSEALTSNEVFKKIEFTTENAKEDVMNDEMSKILTSYEVFRNIDFTSENANIDGVRIDFEEEDLLIKIKFSSDEKTRLLKALEDTTFEKIQYTSGFDMDYRLNITFNKRYEIYLDSKKKLLNFINGDEDSDYDYYKISDESNFFELLNEAEEDEKL